MDVATTGLLRWIILLPLMGALVNGLILRSRKTLVAGAVATAFAVASFAVSVCVVSQFGAGLALDQWFTWFATGRVNVPFHLEYTSITGVMLMVVTGVGSLIHLYATGYMSEEESPWRFFAYLNLFLAAMLVLILSSNLVGVFMGWEGVGLCSYLLIGFWYKEPANTAAGMKAFVVNRIGDLGFVLALMLLVTFAGTTQIRDLVQIAMANNGQVPPWVWFAATMAMFWAATGKSAQLPLYVWLPDAMAGPTPVSALIHAATMVTSGIFVITRLWPLFELSPTTQDVILVIGLATAWIAALSALTQRDIKKVLAYSTVSQLGFMFVALGAGNPTAAMFHVVTHAFFKALLFLGAGSVIHGMHHEQDIYKMGDLKHHMKWTHLTFAAGTAAIIGFPLSSGFFSKDMILAEVYKRSPVFYVLLLGAALLTAFYMLRVYALTFWGKARSKEAEHAHESPAIMTIPLAVLAVLSLFAGWVETPEVIGAIHSFDHWVKASWYGAAEHMEHGHHLSHATEWALMGLSTVLALSVAFFSFKKYSQVQKLDAAEPSDFLGKLSWNKFYVDELYQWVFVRPLSWVAGMLTKIVDGFAINGLLHSLRDGTRMVGQVGSLLHTGSLQTYAWYMAAGATLLLFALGAWLS